MARPSLAVTLPLSLSGCVSLFDPKGPIADQDMQIMIDSLAIMLAIVIPTIVAVALFAWWYRAGNARARYLPDFEYSGQIELVVWSIPALTVLLLAGVIWIGTHRLDPAIEVQGEGKPLEVQVVALDWKWLFLYPEQKVASVNQLVVPVGAPLHLRMTSASVMTAFFVPQWGSMLYVMNGMTSRLNLRADEPGSYRGEASQIAGDGFSDMHFEARAASRADFDAWVKQASGGKPLDEAAYHALERQSVEDVSLHPLADETLFQDIVTQKIAPAPGPEPSPRPSPLGEKPLVR